MRTVAAIFLLALVAGTYAQDFPRLTDALGSFAGRGIDIVYERVKPRLVAHNYDGGYTMMFKDTRYASACRHLSVSHLSLLFLSPFRLSQDNFHLMVGCINSASFNRYPHVSRALPAVAIVAVFARIEKLFLFATFRHASCEITSLKFLADSILEDTMIAAYFTAIF